MAAAPAGGGDASVQGEASRGAPGSHQGSTAWHVAAAAPAVGVNLQLPGSRRGGAWRDTSDMRWTTGHTSGHSSCRDTGGSGQEVGRRAVCLACLWLKGAAGQMHFLALFGLPTNPDSNSNSTSMTHSVQPADLRAQAASWPTASHQRQQQAPCRRLRPPICLSACAASSNSDHAAALASHEPVRQQQDRSCRSHMPCLQAQPAAKKPCSDAHALTCLSACAASTLAHSSRQFTVCQQ